MWLCTNQFRENLDYSSTDHKRNGNHALLIRHSEATKGPQSFRTGTESLTAFAEQWTPTSFHPLHLLPSLSNDLKSNPRIRPDISINLGECRPLTTTTTVSLFAWPPGQHLPPSGLTPRKTKLFVLLFSSTYFLRRSLSVFLSPAYTPPSRESEWLYDGNRYRNFTTLQPTKSFYRVRHKSLHENLAKKKKKKQREEPPSVTRFFHSSERQRTILQV